MSDSVNEASGGKLFFSERHRRILMMILLVIGLFFVIFYGVRAYRNFRRLTEGTQPLVRPWMTIPRISHQFKIPEADLYRALGVRPQHPDRRPLDRLAKEKGVAPHILVEQVQRLVNSYHKPPPPLPLPTPTQALSREMAYAHRPQ